MDWLTHIVFWHWWILAGMLLILELTSPVFFFLWLAFSAAAVGFLLLVFPDILYFHKPISVSLPFRKYAFTMARLILSLLDKQ